MTTFYHPKDSWYHIEARGEHPHRRAGIVQIIDDTACHAIVNRFNEEAGQPGFAGMLIDHEHFKHDQDKETVAYGWLMKLEDRADGIYGKIRWTDTGRKAVDGGDYRFFSTEYDPADLNFLDRGESPQRVRPMRLDGLTLTNANNNKGQKPITNRLSFVASAKEELPSTALAKGDGKEKEQRKMKTVCTLVGLSADASEEAVHAEVARALNRVKELETSQVEADLEIYQNRFDPKQREFIKSLLVTNRAATVEFLKTQPDNKAQLAPARLHNRQTAQPIDSAAGGAATDEVTLSAERSSAVEQYRVTNRCTFQQAYDAVRRKKPSLFGLHP